MGCLISHAKRRTGVGLALIFAMMTVGCATGRYNYPAARNEPDIYRVPLKPYIVYRKLLPPIQKRSDGNYARARGLGGALNVDGQAGQANQAGGIITMAMRSGLSFQEEAQRADLPTPPPDIQPAFPEREEPPMLELSAITRSEPRVALLGRAADLQAMPVARTLNQRVFWMGDSPSDRLLGVLDAAFVAGAPEEQVVVRDGNLVSLGGQLEPLPDVQEMQRRWGLTREEAMSLQGQEVFLHVDRIQFLGEGASPVGGAGGLAG